MSCELLAGTGRAFVRRSPFRKPRWPRSVPKHALPAAPPSNPATVKRGVALFAWPPPLPACRRGVTPIRAASGFPGPHPLRHGVAFRHRRMIIYVMTNKHHTQGSKVCPPPFYTGGASLCSILNSLSPVRAAGQPLCLRLAWERTRACAFDGRCRKRAAPTVALAAAALQADPVAPAGYIARKVLLHSTGHASRCPYLAPGRNGRQINTRPGLRVNDQRHTSGSPH